MIHAAFLIFMALVLTAIANIVWKEKTYPKFMRISILIIIAFVWLTTIVNLVIGGMY